jgi:hypothetical protein
VTNANLPPTQARQLPTVHIMTILRGQESFGELRTFQNHMDQLARQVMPTCIKPIEIHYFPFLPMFTYILCIEEYPNICMEEYPNECMERVPKRVHR